jgi:hypothetical protein
VNEQGQNKDRVMATQQQFPLDPNSALAQLWARNGGRRRQKVEHLSPQSGTMQREQIRSYAHIEARSWEVVDSKERALDLESKWKEPKESIETRNQVLREAAAAGHSLNQEAKTLTDNIALLRESMQVVKAGFGGTKNLPHIEIEGLRCVPRAYASVSSYFRAMNYEFNEQTFEQFFTAAQEIKALEMAEIWQLRPFAELVLLEAVAERADGLENSPYAGREQRLGEEETATRGATVDVQTLVASLRAISDTDWKELLERINVIEQILRKDPCGAYPQMDYESRDSYRKAITEMAERSKASEQSIAQAAMGLANRLHSMQNERIGERQSHVGYYLVGGGRKTLQREIGYWPTIAERLHGFVTLAGFFLHSGNRTGHLFVDCGGGPGNWLAYFGLCGSGAAAAASGRMRGGAYQSNRDHTGFAQDFA